MCRTETPVTVKRNLDVSIMCRANFTTMTDKNYSKICCWHQGLYTQSKCYQFINLKWVKSLGDLGRIKQLTSKPGTAESQIKRTNHYNNATVKSIY
jgi:hypothetical protein